MKKSSLDCFSLICSKKTIALLFFAVFIIMLSCTSALYIPTASQQTASANLSQLQAGRKLYVRKCGSCHMLVLPEKHTKKEWQHFLDEMQQKASINNLEKEQILLYLAKGL
jgi:cytochrome c5